MVQNDPNSHLYDAKYNPARPNDAYAYDDPDKIRESVRRYFTDPDMSMLNRWQAQTAAMNQGVPYQPGAVVSSWNAPLTPTGGTQPQPTTNWEHPLINGKGPEEWAALGLPPGSGAGWTPARMGIESPNMLAGPYQYDPTYSPSPQSSGVRGADHSGWTPAHMGIESGDQGVPTVNAKPQSSGVRGGLSAVSGNQSVLPWLQMLLNQR
jgi:hypothetical protein